MSEESKVKYSERPTTPPEEEEATVFYRDTRTVYSEDGERFVKMSPDRGFDFDFDHITDVSILDGTKIICDDAFAELDNLRTIKLPNSVTHIGDCAFLRCKSLESIHIPDSVQFIGYQAFAECSSLRRFDSSFASEDGRCLVINNVLVAVAPCELEELHIPQGVISIAGGAFASCPGLKSISLPDSLVSFPLTCFTRCTNLESLFSKYASEDNKSIIIDNKLILCIENNNELYSIPSGVNVIGVGAFGRNQKLVEIHLPPSVTRIEAGAFAGCSSLQEIHLQPGVESIGYGAFMQCKSLKSIVLPDTVRTLGASSFNGCEALTCIEISNALERIESETFMNCSSLIFVSIPDSVVFIGEHTFENCKELEAIKLPQRLEIVENNLFDNCETLRQIEIPESVRTIKRMSFYGCSSLQKVTFPSALEEIEEVSFNYCRALEKVDLSRCEKIKRIEERTFYACSGMATLLLPKSLKSIEKESFAYCSHLEALTIPKTVERIENRAFQDCGLKSVCFQSTDIHVDHYAFYHCRQFETAFIPTGALDYFFTLLKSLATVNISGHMTFFEVGDSINDVKAESRRLLSDTFISKPLARLGECDHDYRTTSTRSYVIHENGETKLSDIKVISISCYSSCTGCIRIGNNIVYNWPGDSWLQGGSNKRVSTNLVDIYLHAADIIEDLNKRYVLLVFALKLLLEEISSKGIELDEELEKVICYELSDEVEKGWSYTAYDTGNDPSAPASMVPPPGVRENDGRPHPSVGIISVIIRILEELLQNNEQ